MVFGSKSDADEGILKQIYRCIRSGEFIFFLNHSFYFWIKIVGYGYDAVAAT